MLKRNLSFVLQETFFFLLLSSFFLFLSFGNLFRLVESSLFSDNLMLTESLLYLFCFLSFPFLRISKKSLSVIFVASSFIAISFFYGCALQGFDLHAGLYALRLALLLFSILIITEVSFKKFKGDLTKFFIFLFNAYGISLILGALLYVLFPSAEELWILLKNYHIGFQGDPHMGRFVSVYFDPNYYASIAGLIFLIASYLYKTTKKNRYQLGAFIFFLSGIFTWSRSGIFILTSLIIYKIGPSLIRMRFTKKGFLFGFLFSTLGLLLIIPYLQEAGIFLERTFHFFEEDSALCRLNTLQFGLSLLEKFPTFGIGINFLYKYAQEEFSLNSLDSSILSLLIQIGILPFLTLLFYCFIKSLSFIKIRNLCMEKDTEIPYFFSWFCFYALGIIFFASQFNNLLFYPFWVIPFGVIFLFIIKRSRLPESSLHDHLLHFDIPPSLKA